MGLESSYVPLCHTTIVHDSDAGIREGAAEKEKS